MGDYALMNNVYVLGGFATMGGMLIGFDISSMSGVVGTARYQEYFKHPSSSLQGEIVASMAAGSFLGALLAGPLGDKVSRRRTIMLASSIWICAAVNAGMLIVGRIINGVAVGLASIIVPVYQSEIAPKEIRGRIVSLQQWAITWGILIQYFIQYGCSYIQSDAAFRIPWGIQVVPGLILFCGTLLFPYSPRWLADQNRSEEALEVLANLRANGDKNDPAVVAEFKEIQDAITFDRTQAARSYGELFRHPYSRRVFLGMTLQSWSQLTGMSVAMYYIVFIFQGGMYGSATQFSGNATTTWAISDNDAASKAVIACSYLFVCSFVMSWGPVSWTYPAEIYPLRIRSKAVSLSTASNWAFNFVLAYAVPPALEHIQYRTYFIFAGCCVAMTIHTKGRTLEEMEELFNSDVPAWKTRALPASHLDADIERIRNEKTEVSELK
ncbi:hypothetical protein BGZ75_005997 [Mortierella antarctica]|nr:hypothetical protein BGZ75_005997 [Mortierella antarctica]